MSGLPCKLIFYNVFAWIKVDYKWGYIKVKLGNLTHDDDKNHPCMFASTTYYTYAIITRGLYTFYPFFEVQKRFFKGLEF